MKGHLQEPQKPRRCGQIELGNSQIAGLYMSSMYVQRWALFCTLSTLFKLHKASCQKSLVLIDLVFEGLVLPCIDPMLLAVYMIIKTHVQVTIIINTKTLFKK